MSIAPLLKHVWRRMWGRHAIKYGIAVSACSLATWMLMQYRISGNYLLVAAPLIGFTLSLLSCVLLVNLFLDYWPQWDRARQLVNKIESSVNLVVRLFVYGSVLFYANGYFDASRPAFRFGEITSYHRVPAISSWLVTVRYRDDPGSAANVILTDEEYRDELWGAEPVCVTVREGALGIPVVLKIEKDWDSYGRRIVKLAPTASGIWTRLIDFNFSHNRSNEAIASAQEYLTVNPHDYYTAGHVGDILFSEGRAKDSIQFFEIAAAQHPTYEYLQSFGTALSYAGKHKQAAEVLEGSIQLRPEDWEAYYHLGYVYLGLRKPQEAITWFEKVLERRPDFPEVKSIIAATNRIIHDQKPRIPAKNKQ